MSIFAFSDFYKMVVFVVIWTSFFGNNILPIYAQNSTQNSQSQSVSQVSQNTYLEYQNLDLTATDGVKLRPNVDEMGKAWMESGSGRPPKYDKVVDIKTCTKKEIYRFFYNLTDNPGSFENFTTPNPVLNTQMQSFYEQIRYGIEYGKERKPVKDLEYTNTRYKANESMDLSDVDILLTSKIDFTQGGRRGKTIKTNSYLNKENISFQVEYKDSKCNIVQTNFFDIVIKDKTTESNSNNFILTIFFLVFLFIVVIISLIGKLLWNFVFKLKKK